MVVGSGEGENDKNKHVVTFTGFTDRSVISEELTGGFYMAYLPVQEKLPTPLDLLPF